MGYMSSGHSIEVVRLCDYYFNTLNLSEKYVRENISQIIKLIKKKRPNIGYRFHFVLWLEENKIFAYELYSNLKVELGPFLGRKIPNKN